jgi:hypothetical protein
VICWQRSTPAYQVALEHAGVSTLRPLLLLQPFFLIAFLAV